MTGFSCVNFIIKKSMCILTVNYKTISNNNTRKKKLNSNNFHF